MPMMTLVMAMCECQLFYVFTKKVQQYGAQCIMRPFQVLCKLKKLI